MTELQKLGRIEKRLKHGWNRTKAAYAPESKKAFPAVRRRIRATRFRHKTHSRKSCQTFWVHHSNFE